MKITKRQLKRIIKEELSRALRENEGMPMPAEEVTHEEVIEKVQELPQGALAQIWELIKDLGWGMAQNLADMPSDTLGREDMGLEEKKNRK